MVQTIITLARSMKMQVIAEGVEDERQLALLRDMTCDYGKATSSRAHSTAKPPAPCWRATYNGSCRYMGPMSTRL
jgi:predicted signal transduction protein with EAL and GGDEF domain